MSVNFLIKDHMSKEGREDNNEKLRQISSHLFKDI
jgi:hypothetical protein